MSETLEMEILFLACYKIGEGVSQTLEMEVLFLACYKIGSRHEIFKEYERKN